MSDVLSIAKTDFDAEAFVPASYNQTYYSEVMEDEACLIKWQAGELHQTITDHLKKQGLIKFSHQWDAGSGPAVHHLFALEKYSDTIRLSDYLPENLAEIQKWVRGESDAHNWDPFVSDILTAEGKLATANAIDRREKAVRSKISSYSPLDLKAPTEEMKDYRAPFVTSFFVADSATGDKEIFAVMTKNAFDMVETGGLFVAAYLGGCEAYKVGDQWVVSANVQQSDIEQALEAAGAKNIQIRRFDTPSMADEGFDHIFTVTATA